MGGVGSRTPPIDPAILATSRVACTPSLEVGQSFHATPLPPPPLSPHTSLHAPACFLARVFSLLVTTFSAYCARPSAWCTFPSALGCFTAAAAVSVAHAAVDDLDRPRGCCLTFYSILKSVFPRASCCRTGALIMTDYNNRGSLRPDQRSRQGSQTSMYTDQYRHSPRPGSHASLYAADGGRRGSPASFYAASQSGRPNTPGTPGTFDSGLASFAPQQYDPFQHGARSPSPNPVSPRDNTYYFSDKEGRGGAGAAAGAGGVGAGAAAAGSRKAAQRGGPIGWIKRHPVWTGLIALLIVAAIVGAAVGGVVGSNSMSSSAGNSNADSSASAKKNPDGSVGNSQGGTSGTNVGNSTSSDSDGTITPLAKWDQTDPNTKTIGASLGNWLLLERWISEDWFTGTAGNDAWDEWSFTENLGQAKAKAALTDHWNTWVVESDFDTLKSAGVNSVRIPVGYWAFLPAVSGEPYVAQAGQTDQITKVLGWLYDRGMYAMIDLHGMPGSQSGDQASGHNTSDVQWFQDSNINYSYQVLNATIDFIKNSKYSSVVHSVCPVNEPKPGSSNSKRQIVRDYYENSYNILKAAGLIMQFHHAFISDPYSYWQDFATGKDPAYIAMNDNPYPGWFPPNSDGDAIISSICSTAKQASQFPIPVVMTEYSLVNNVQSDTFNQKYYDTEASAFSWSAGAYFWTFKTEHSSSQVLGPADYVADLYSMTGLIESGVIGKVGTTSTALQTIQSLPNQQCGDIPTVTWSTPSGSGSSSSSRRGSSSKRKSSKN